MYTPPSKLMKRTDLARTADALLSQVERDASAPHYTENTFRRKVIDANRRAFGAPYPLGGKEWHYLLRQEWREVVERARLTDRQSEVLSLRLEGRTFEEIGVRYGHSKQGAQNIYFQAAKKLVRAWADYPYRGLHQVFRDEVRRGAPRPK